MLRRLPPSVPHFLPELVALLVGHMHPFVFPGEHLFAAPATETPIESLPFVVMPVVIRPPETAKEYFA
ncbi:hypothetical protein D3C86_1953540 [compost metagenome]